MTLHQGSLVVAMDMKTVGGWNAYHWLSGEQCLVAMDTECMQSPFNYFIEVNWLVETTP